VQNCTDQGKARDTKATHDLAGKLDSLSQEERRVPGLCPASFGLEDASGDPAR
jgi:hypothetical protein